MNITALRIKMMISTTATWLESDKFRKQLESAGPLGAGVLAELELAHHFLADLANRRKLAHTKLRAVMDRVTRLDQIHDDKARGLYYALDALIALAPSPGARARLTELQRQLFPLGLRIVGMTHLEESGAAEELELSVGPELREQLAKISIGDQSLDQVLDEWIGAGKALGKAVARREQLKASLKVSGTEGNTIDLRAGRRRWIHAVRGLMWMLDLQPKLASLRESVESALAHAIELSSRQRDKLQGEGEGADEDEGLVTDEGADESDDEDGEPDEAADADADQAAQA